MASLLSLKERKVGLPSISVSMAIIVSPELVQVLQGFLGVFELQIAAVVVMFEQRACGYCL